MDYNGYKQLRLSESELVDLYNGKFQSEDFKENEYLISENDDKTCDYFCYKNNKFEHLNYPIIENCYVGKIKPLDSQQYCAMDLLNNRNIPVKLISGVYGSGKDYLMFNKALSLIENNVFDKIVFIRPNITLKNIPDIGYLPNGIDEKLGWTMAPLYDKVGGQEGIDMLVRQNKFEMVPLLFIRGRSFENSIVYVTEAQNIDSSIAKVLLSRIGANSELWLNGDYHHQTDNKIFDKDNGLSLMVERLQGNPLFGYINLMITHRSDVANLSNLLD